MEKSLKIIGLLTLYCVFVNCIPTSVLVDTTKDLKLGTSSNKVKRAPIEPSRSSEKITSGIGVHEQNFIPHKRGASPLQLPYDLSNDILVNNIPNGVWDDTDASALYPDLQELEEQYQRKVPYGIAPNRQKSYENLQNLLNSQMYSEPLALPVEYPYRYYGGDRKKRSSGKAPVKKTLRLKRDTKLSPADILTLLALYESGREQQSRYPTIEDDYQYEYPPQEETSEWLNSWNEPQVQYLPYEFDNYNTYNDIETPQKNKYPAATKRFMISKKKRTSYNHNQRLNQNHNINAAEEALGAGSANQWHYGQEKFLSEPQQFSNYDYGRYALPELLDNTHKNYRRYYQK